MSTANPGCIHYILNSRGCRSCAEIESHGVCNSRRVKGIDEVHQATDAFGDTLVKLTHEPIFAPVYGKVACDFFDGCLLFFR